MALQVCPKCKGSAFTWYIDEEQSLLTQWACQQCGYHVFEDEDRIQDCPFCGKKEAYCFMLDDNEKYWWCWNCGKIERIGAVE